LGQLIEQQVQQVFDVLWVLVGDLPMTGQTLLLPLI
jgi:hypothetical protein